MTDPITPAGRALLHREPLKWRASVAPRIAAIESQAAAPYREALERLADAVQAEWDSENEEDDTPHRRSLIAVKEARALLRREVGE